MKRTLSILLSMVIVLSLLGSVSIAAQASVEQGAVYGSKNLIQVTEPVIGESYYLAADVGGTMMYFRHGTVSDTVPYSLVVTDNIDHNWTSLVTLEDPSATDEKYTEGFQLTYINPTNSTMGRIYCMDALKDATVAGQTGIMDTGVNSSTPYKNRHNFYVADVNGVKVLKSTGNGNILVIKQVPQTVSGVTTNVWRMLGVPETELANEGVYPAALYAEQTEHAEHTFGAWSFDTEKGTQSRLCTVCGLAETLHGTNSKVYQAETPVIGESYYLVANVAGVLKFFTKDGAVTATAPYSLSTTERVGIATQITLEDSTKTSEKFEGGFQLTFDNNGTLTRIYCMDVLKDATTAGQTGIMDTGMQSGTGYKNRHSFFVDEVNGEKVLRKYGNDNILVVKLNATTNTYRMLGVPEAELENEGVYPVMIATAHTHTYGTVYEKDENSHWQICDCGAAADKEDHNFENGTCVCGQEVIPVLAPAFSGKSISLQDDFSINLYVEKAVFVDGVYSDPYVVFELEGEQTTVTAYTQKDDYYVFTFDDITPDKMGQKVHATLYADKQDGTQFSVTKDYSVAEYCYAALELEQTSDAFRRLLVDTLNFGAVCQLYRNSDVAVEELVNAALTEEQRGWGSDETIRELESCRDFGRNTGKVRWEGVSGLMGEAVKLRVYFQADDITGLTVQAVSSIGEWNLNDIKAKDGMYYVDFGYLNPTQMNEKVSFTVYQGENALSSTLDYSIESYAAVWVNKTDVRPEQVELVKAIIRYGDAAKAYVERVYDLQQDVLYLGRTYEAAGTQWFNWSASGFSVRFQGSGLKAKIASNAPDATNYAYLKVYVDGVEQTDILLDKTMQTVTLAEGLNPDEIHTVEVRKRNSPRSSTAGVLSIELLDGKKLAPPEKKEKLIEFIGDSLTVGYSAADVNKTLSAWSTATEDATKTYSKQVADEFGAEYMVTAISGRGVVMNNSGGSGYLLPDIYPELDIYNTPGIAYDFALQPDVIVINLGTNDATNANLNLDTFQAGVYSFIKLVRQKNPNAQIIWAYGLRSDKMTAQVATAIEAAVAQLKTEGDSKVHYLALPLAADMHLNHPTAAAYAPSGEKLIAKIREITGW